MTARPWMPLYIADYLADTAHLGALQSGAYLHLIMHYWQNSGLPDNEPGLARIARLSPPEWKRERSTLAAFFHDGWKHKRIDEELAHAAQVSAKRRASAEQRHNKSNANASANAEQLDTHTRGLSQPQSQEELEPPSAVVPPAELDDAKRAIEIYNTAASEVGWPLVQRATAPRLTALRARLRESGGIVGWQAAIDKAKASLFLCGENDRGWKADFDFLCKSNHFTKLMEGGYDRTAGSTNGAGARPHETVLRSIARVVEKRAGHGERQASADGPPTADGTPPPPFGALDDGLEIPANLRRY